MKEVHEEKRANNGRDLVVVAIEVGERKKTEQQNFQIKEVYDSNHLFLKIRLLKNVLDPFQDFQLCCCFSLFHDEFLLLMPSK